MSHPTSHPTPRLLANYSCRPLIVPPAYPFALRGLVVTKRAQSVELILADSITTPIDAQVFSSWNMHAAGRHVPVILAVAQAEQVSLCGPDSKGLPTNRTFPVAQAEELCAAALESGDWSRLLATLRGSSDGPLIVSEKATQARPAITAEEVKLSDVNWTRRRAFFEWSEFLLGQSHVMRRHPELLPQQAANQPATSAPARAAVQWRQGRGRRRPWFRLLNPPKEHSACVSVLSGHADVVTACRFFPGGDQLVSTSLDGTVKIWDLASGRVRVELAGGSRALNACAISPNGKWIVAGDAEGRLGLWASANGERSELLRRRSVAITACAFSPDGRLLVAGCADGALALLDTMTWKIVTELSGSPGPVRFCTVTPRGRWLIAAAGNALLRWSAERPEEPLTLRAHDRPIAACAISPDERWILSASRGELKLTSPDGEHRRSIKARADVLAASFSPDGRWLALTHESDIEIRDTGDGTSARHVLRGHAGDVTACSFSSDGRLLASCSRDGTIRLWLVERIPASESPLERKTLAVPAVSIDGRRIATVGAGQLTVWERRAETTHEGHPENPNDVLACDFSPNGWTLVATTETKLVHVWRSLNSGSTLKGHRAPVTVCAFSPDGRWLASGSADHTVRIWNAGTWLRAATLDGHEGTVNALLFHVGHDLSLFSGSDDGTVRHWTLDGKERSHPRQHAGPVRACAFSPDYRWLASGSDDGSVTIWPTGRGQAVAVLEGHDGSVRHCAYSADGRWLLSCADDGILRLWNASKFTLQASLANAGATGSSSVFSPDGAHVASATGETVSLWDLERREEVGRFFTDGLTTSLRWSPSGCLAVGTDAGVLHLLSVENLGPLRLTAWRQPSGWNPFERKTKLVHFGCPVCRKWSTVDSSRLENELQCPGCQTALILNAFQVEAEWQPIQAAWAE